MFTETSISLFVGGAAFVRAEFLSRWNGTFIPRMGALILSHDCLLARVTFACDKRIESQSIQIIRISIFSIALDQDGFLVRLLLYSFWWERPRAFRSPLTT